MSDTVKIKYYIRTDKVGSTCEDIEEFDRDDWGSMSDDKREAVMRELGVQLNGVGIL